MPDRLPCHTAIRAEGEARSDRAVLARCGPAVTGGHDQAHDDGRCPCGRTFEGCLGCYFVRGGAT